MNEQVLIELSNKLGTTVEFLYSTIVRQAFAEGIMCVFSSIILSTLAYFLFRIMHKTIKSECDNIGKGLLSLFFGVFLFLLICGAFMDMREAVICFTNPDYWAIKELLKAIN